MKRNIVNSLLAAAVGIISMNVSMTANAEEMITGNTPEGAGIDENETLGMAETDDTQTSAPNVSPDTVVKPSSTPTTFDEAKKNLEEAKAAETEAKADVDSAQAEVNESQDEVDLAQKEVTDADEALNQSVSAADEAEEKKNAADEAVEKAESDVTDAETALDEALKDADADEEKYNAALEDIEQKEEELNEAQNVYNEKAQDTEDAKLAKDEAQAVVDSTQAAADAAQNAVTAAQDDYDTAKQAYDDALEQDKSDVVDVAKKALDEAQNAYTAAQDKVESGSLGFFQHMADQGSESAAVAVKILTSKDGSDLGGLRDKDNWDLAVESWENFISNTDIGAENDATNLENVKKVFEYIEECNSLRTSDNNFPDCEDLMVNDALMAIAQLNANWASNIIAVHSSVFSTGENLAWYPEGWDPFRGWYDKEKDYYDEGHTVWDSDNGHYLNITTKNYYATGYGINSYTSSMKGNYAHAQEFNNEVNLAYYGYGDSYSVSEYKERFMGYYDTVMAELDNAKASYDAALAAYEKVVASGAGSLEIWQANVAAKKADLDNAASALETAQNEAARLQEELKEVTDAYDAAKEIYTNHEDELFLAEADLDAKKTAYEEAVDSVKEKFGETVIKANRDLWEAEAKYDEALAFQTEAETVFNQAQEALNEAKEAKKAADENLETKTGILSIKKQALADAKNAYYLTVANLAIAQADYERLKPLPAENPDTSLNVAEIRQMDTEDTERVTQADESEFIGSITIRDSIENNNRTAILPRNCSFRFFENSLEKLIKECPYNNLVIDCSATPWFSMHEKVLKALKDNPDMSLTVRFRYKGKKYAFTIPAGYDLNLLKDSKGWYGFMYLNMVFSGHEIV